jgi:hypothetical protein
VSARHASGRPFFWRHRKYSRAQVFSLMEVLPALSSEEFPRPRPNLP